MNDVLNVVEAKSLVQRVEETASDALEVGVNSLDGDAVLDERKGLADSLDDGRGETLLNESDKLLSEGHGENALDLDEGLTEDGVELLLELVDAQAILKLSDDAAEVRKKTTLLDCSWRVSIWLCLCRSDGPKENIPWVGAAATQPAMAATRTVKKRILNECGGLV